jgi:hypothetical protein
VFAVLDWGVIKGGEWPRPAQHVIWVNFLGQMIPVDQYSHFQAYLEVRQGRPVNPMSPS